MQGIEKITARIEADAAADAAKAAELAKGQCDSIRADGERRAAEVYDSLVRAGAAEAEDIGLRSDRAADMESRKSILACKQAIVAEAFDKAEQKILSMDEDAYIDFLAGQAARASVTGCEHIVLNAADRERCGSMIVSGANVRLAGQGRTGRLILDEETRNFRAGLVLKDGSIEVNCTLETLMAQAREAMAPFAASELFD